MMNEKRRPTVNVSCSVPNGLQIALHQIHKGFMGQETRVPLGDMVTLKQGKLEPLGCPERDDRCS
jgi:hypothetical protein